MLYNAVLNHACLLDAIVYILIIPLLRDKKGDVTLKDNYRPIAITGILPKVL